MWEMFSDDYELIWWQNQRKEFATHAVFFLSINERRKLFSFYSIPQAGSSISETMKLSNMIINKVELSALYSDHAPNIVSNIQVATLL